MARCFASSSFAAMAFASLASERNQTGQAGQASLMTKKQKAERERSSIRVHYGCHRAEQAATQRLLTNGWLPRPGAWPLSLAPSWERA